PASLPSGTVNVAYPTINLTGSDGNASDTFTFTISSGTLPAGITFATRTFSGVPTAIGTFPVDVTAKSNLNPSSVGVAHYAIVVSNASATAGTLNITMNVVGGFAQPSDFAITVMAGHPSPTSTFSGSTIPTPIVIDIHTAYHVNVAPVANYTILKT